MRITPQIKVVLLLCLLLVVLLLSGCDSSEEVSSTLTWTYTMKQCVATPWETWYTEGEIRYVAEPSPKQLLEDYYSQVHGIGITVTERYHEQVCEACGICPRELYFEVELSRAPAIIKEQGWTQ